MSLSRRGLLRGGAALGGGLLFQLWLPPSARAKEPPTFIPNAWLQIPPGGPLMFICDRVEMGQGAVTGLAMLLAEELAIAPAALKIVFAPANRAYDNPALHFQLTGGSTSIKTSWETLRAAGASARETLRHAAAKDWKVSLAECSAEDGAIVHAASGRRASYVSLAAAAAQGPIVEAEPRTSSFRLIGKPLPRLDAPWKIDGSGVYGIDVKVPEARVAVVVRCPVPGGKVKSFDATAARAMPGVTHVVEIPSGVAVVGQGYWYARQAAEKISVVWDEGPHATLDTDAIRARYAALAAKKGGKSVRATGDVAAALKGAAKVIEATYSAPYLAHATMEPQNATARVTPERCEIWAPTQGPGIAKEIARRITGLSEENILVRTTLLGGGFGRRIAQDYVAEAVHLSKQLKLPVKVIWSREDDLRHDVYRPAEVSVLQGGLAADGKPVAWHHTLVSQSILRQVGEDFIGTLLPFGIPTGLKNAASGMATHFASSGDETAYEGAHSLPYELPHVAVSFHEDEPGVPVGFWRSVGHSHTGFVVESFVDELAHAAGADPYEFRRGLLSRKHRERGVLEAVAAKAGWASPAGPGVFRGIAQHASFDSYAAAVAEVSVEKEGLRVRRLVMGIDCGRVVNPDLVAAQLESSAIFGLSAALKQQIHFKAGRVQESNFHDYETLRMYEAPAVETCLVENEAPPTGVGEPGVPVVAPAVANAVFAATGKRMRDLPLSL